MRVLRRFTAGWVALALLDQPALAQTKVGPVARSEQNTAGGYVSPDASNTVSAQSVIPTTGNTALPLNALLGERLSVTAGGAKCDGSTDDAATITALASSLSSAGGGYLVFPRGRVCGYGSTISVPAGVKLVGPGYQTISLKALSTNFTAIKFTGSNSGMVGLGINCGSAGANSSGACVDFSDNVQQILVDDFYITGPFVGIHMGTVVLVTVQNGYIYAPTQTTGIGIQVTGTSGGNNQILNNIFMEGISQTKQPKAALEIQATGGMNLTNVQGLWMGNGMVVDPGAGQFVTWLFDTNSQYDTGTGSGYVFSPTGGGSIRGYQGVQTWASTNQGAGVVTMIDSGNGSVLDGVQFIGHRSYNNALQGFDLRAGSDILLNDSQACGNSTAGSAAYSGIRIGASVSKVKVANGASGPCEGFTNAQAYGVEVLSGANDVDVLGEDLRGNSAGPLAFGGPITNANIANNKGVDDQLPSVPSAATVALPVTPTVYVTGTSTISTITGGWQGRKVTLIPNAAWSTATGGNIATAMTATANVPIQAVYIGSSWYLR